MSGESGSRIRGALFRHHDLRVVRGFYLIVALFIVTIVCLMAVCRLQASVLDSVRAYVAGEGYWSKGQKEALYHLTRYSLTGDEASYHLFQQGIAVTLGDSAARKALQLPEPDIKRAREGLLLGDNHPDDVDKMIDFFLDFQDLSYLRTAIGIWATADDKIEELVLIGKTMHREIAHQGADPARIHALLERVDALNVELTTLENRFSATLGEAARWSRQLTRNVVMASVLMLLGLAMLLSWRIVRGIHATEKQLIASEARFRRVVDADMIGTSSGSATAALSMPTTPS